MEPSKYLDVFIEEAKENLQVVNSVLLSLEEKGFDEARMDEAFRVVHTIKGTAGVIGIEPISELAHVMEDLFDILRKSKEAPEKAMLQLLFAGADRIEKMLDDLERTGTTSVMARDLIAKMAILRDQAAPAAPERVDSSAELKPSPEHLSRLEELKAEGKRPWEIRATFEPGLKLREGRAYQVVREMSKLGVVVASAPVVEGLPDAAPQLTLLVATDRAGDDLAAAARGVTGIKDAAACPFRGAPEAPPSASAKEAPKRETKEDEKCSPIVPAVATIRVRTKLLDQLLDLVGETMISNIRINQISNDIKHRELKQALKNNSRLVGELQDIVLRTRMVPVDFIFKRFPRIVRDIAQDHGKEIEFTMKGNDIEIDRGLLDEIGDSLVHLLRNAVDHGIEPKEARTAAGKRPQGTVVLSAYQEQSSIVITVEDDGRGMDAGKIAAKAVSKGLISEEDAERMDDRAKLQLVFLPGLSTAEKITDISGRGVGMDVVKTKIESLGGVVRLDTVLGKGSKITLRLPPSMSIIRAMLVEVNAEKYAIPLENVRETVRVPRDAVHEVASQAVFKLRDEVLPVLDVNEEFGGSETMLSAGDAPAIIVEKNDSRACLLVSRLIGQQEIVVKNVGKDLRRTGYFSGATILGDGKVAMILDVGAFI